MLEHSMSARTIPKSRCPTVPSGDGGEEGEGRTGVFVYDLCFAGCGCTSACGEYLLYKSLKELPKNFPLTFVLIFSTALHKKNTLGRKNLFSPRNFSFGRRLNTTSVMPNEISTTAAFVCVTACVFMCVFSGLLEPRCHALVALIESNHGGGESPL